MAAGDRIRYRPAEALTPDEVGTLRKHKQEILAALRRRDPIAEYRNVLGRLWLLNVPDSRRDPRAHETDAAEARALLAEQARLCDDLGPEFAAAVSRQHAPLWARTMNRCPWCGMAGMFHDPDTGQEIAL